MSGSPEVGEARYDATAHRHTVLLPPLVGVAKGNVPTDTLWKVSREPTEPTSAKPPSGPLLRAMTPADIPAVVAVQEPASIAALGDVFPQAEYPFPRDEIGRRWREEVEAAGTDCFVILDHGDVVGFAATRGDELLHFGVTVGRWGTGLAGRAHDAVLETLRGRGHARAWLRVFTGNGRARAFYAKHGWQPTGDRTRSTFAPHPELLRYERDLHR